MLCQTGSPPAVAPRRRCRTASPRSCSRRFSARTAKSSVSSARDRALLLDPVARCGRARSPGTGTTPSVIIFICERERDHVRVGRRQLVAHAEAADVVVVRPGARGRPRRRATTSSRSGSSRLAAAAQAGQLARQLGDRAGQRARVERRERRRRVELLGAPRSGPEQVLAATRTTLPLTPPDAGLTRTRRSSRPRRPAGRPAASEFIRRPGLARRRPASPAVIAVSMKPGATALIVARRSASTGASASTVPITPAFVVA